MGRIADIFDRFKNADRLFHRAASGQHPFRHATVRWKFAASFWRCDGIGKSCPIHEQPMIVHSTLRMRIPSKTDAAISKLARRHKPHFGWKLRRPILIVAHKHRIKIGRAENRARVGLQSHPYQHHRQSQPLHRCANTIQLLSTAQGCSAATPASRFIPLFNFCVFSRLFAAIVHPFAPFTCKGGTARVVS